MRTKAFAVAAALATGLGGPAAAQQVMVIASNPQGSVYYGVCVALAKTMDAKLGMQLRVQPMGGSTIYIPILARGEVEFALTNVFDTMTAYAGTVNFKRPNPDLRPMAVMFPLSAGYMVPDDSPIRTIADLKGKALPGGFKAQTIGLILQSSMLGIAGLTEKDIRIVPAATQFAGVDLLADGKVDAALISIGTAQGQAAHAALSGRGGVRFLDFGNSPQTAAALKKLMPARPLYVEPAPARVGVKKPIWVMGYNVYFTSNAKVPEETVYRVVKMLHGAKADLVRNAPVLGGFDPGRMVEDVGVPWHPGAVRFYKEIGQWPPKPS